MTAPEQPKTEDIKQSLEQLGTETTAADLVRAKGQTRKVRVIHEKQLMEWILRLLQQHLASKADAFSDAEKEELLKKAQDELARRIKREQELASERDKAKLAMGDLMERMSQAQATQADRDTLLAELKAQLEEREQVIQDLQNDTDDLRDQLSEKVALLSTTLAEKDKLRLTVRNQMIRSGSLVEGVLGLDSTYYGSRHQNDNPVPDDAGEEEQFYHDFDLGASVVATLSSDLERLRAIAQAAGDRPDEQEPQDAGLLERNLALLEQLKSGSLHAMDVADPVAGLVEALDGARAEAEAFNNTMSGALGHAAGQGIELSELPDASGDPAEVLAAATAVTRELGAELARGRTRLQALKSMADEADEARQNSEAETENAIAACNTLLVSIAARAETVGVDTPHLLSDYTAPLAERMPVAETIIQRLRDTEHREIERLTAALNAVSTERDALTVRVTNVETQTERLTTLAKNVQQEKVQLAERLATDQIKLAADHHEIERLTSVVTKLTTERDALAVRISEIESRTVLLAQASQTAVQEKAQLEERLIADQAAIAAGQQEVVRLTDLATTLTNERDNLAARVSTIESQAARLTKETKSAAQEKQQLLERLGQFEQELAATKTTCDEVRQSSEAETQNAIAACNTLLVSIAARAETVGVDIPHLLSNSTAPLAERMPVAETIIQRLRDTEHREIERLTAALNAVSTERDALTVRVTNVETQTERLTTLAKNVEQEKQQLEERLATDQIKIEADHHEIERLTSVVTKLTTERDALAVRISEIESRTVLLAQASQTAAQEKAQLEERLIADQAAIAAGQQEVVRLTDLATTLTNERDNLAARVSTIESQAARLTKETKSAAQEKQQLLERLGQLEQELAATKTTCDEVRQSSEAETQNAIAACNTLLVSIAARAETVGVDIPHLLSNSTAPLAERMPVAETIIQRLRDTEHREIERLTATLNAVSTERDALTVRVTNVETQTERLTTLAKNVEQEKQQLEERLATDQIKIEADHQEIDRLTSVVTNLTTERDTLAVRISEIESRTVRLAQASQTAAQEKAQLEERLIADQAAIAAGQQEIVRLADLATTLTNERDNLVARVSTIESQAARLTKETQTAAQEKQQLLERLDQLEQELAATKTNLKETEQRAEAASAAQQSLAVVLLSNPSVANQTPTDPVDQAVRLNEAARNLTDTCEALTNRVHYQEKTIDELREHATLAEQRLSEAYADRDEMAKNGKEIINQLTQQRDARAQEVEALRREQSALTGRITGLEARTLSAEATIRTLSESLTDIATATTGDAGIASDRAEFESSLAQLPDSDEHGVVAPAELGRELATNGRKLAQALKENLQQLGETKKTAEALTTKLATVNAQLIDRERALATQTNQLEQIKQTHIQVLAQAATLQQQHVVVATELSQVSERLRQAEAETADQRARGATSQDLAHADYSKALQDLDQAHAHIDALEEQVTELGTQIAAAESRLVAQREDLSKRLAERDSVIQHKDRIIDQQAAQRADSKAQEAQISALRQELVAAAARMAELEAQTHVVQSETVRSDDLGRELTGLQGERDQLREQLRRIESDLAEERSLRSQVESQLAERTKDIASSRSRIASEMVEVRERSRALIEENRRLRQDVAGLQARLKRLLDGGKSSPSGAHQILPSK